MKLVSVVILIIAPMIIGVLMGPVLDLIIVKIISGIHYLHRGRSR